MLHAYFMYVVAHKEVVVNILDIDTFFLLTPELLGFSETAACVIIIFIRLWMAVLNVALPILLAVRFSNTHSRWIVIPIGIIVSLFQLRYNTYIMRIGIKKCWELREIYAKGFFITGL